MRIGNFNTRKDKELIPGLFGAIAQLGERLRGTQEVGGSIPPSSTILDTLFQQHSAL